MEGNHRDDILRRFVQISNRCPCDLSRIDRTRFDSWFYVKEDLPPLACKEERERGVLFNRIDAADRFLLSRRRPLHVRLIAAQSVAYQLEHALSFSSPSNISKLRSIHRSMGESLPLKCINLQPIKGQVIKKERLDAWDPRKEFFSFPSSKNSLLAGTIFEEQFYSQMNYFESIYLCFSIIFTKKILHRNYLSVEKEKPRIYFNWYVERKERPPSIFPPPSPPPVFLDLHPFVPEIHQATTNFCGSSFRRKRLIIITIGRTMYCGFYDKKRRRRRRRRRRKENNIEFLKGGRAVQNELQPQIIVKLSPLRRILPGERN